MYLSVRGRMEARTASLDWLSLRSAVTDAVLFVSFCHPRALRKGEFAQIHREQEVKQRENSTKQRDIKMETHFPVIHVQITCVLERKQARFTCSTAAIYEALKANVCRFAYCLLPPTTPAKWLQAFWERGREHDYGLLVSRLGYGCLMSEWKIHCSNHSLLIRLLFLCSDLGAAQRWKCYVCPSCLYSPQDSIKCFSIWSSFGTAHAQIKHKTALITFNTFTLDDSSIVFVSWNVVKHSAINVLATLVFYWCFAFCECLNGTLEKVTSIVSTANVMRVQEKLYQALCVVSVSVRDNVFQFPTT